MRKIKLKNLKKNFNYYVIVETPYLRYGGIKNKKGIKELIDKGNIVYKQNKKILSQIVK